MLRVIMRRLVIAVPTMFLVCTFTFFLVHLVPGSPADYILQTSQPSASEVARLNRQLGLDKPLLDQYFSWLGHAVRGNFGTSYTLYEPVSRAISQSIQPTLSLAIISTIIAVLLGLGLGMIAAVRGGLLDRAIQMLGSLGLAIPGFWLGALLAWAFAIKLSVFPATGYTNIQASPGDWARSIVLPVATVAFGTLAQMVVQARSSVLDVLSRDFVRTLQAEGLPRRQILAKHVLRNAAIPIATVTGITFVYALSGVVVVESVFSLPGLGTLIVNAADHHDIPVIQGTVVYFSLVVVVVTLLTDLVTAWLDPRVHVS